MLSIRSNVEILRKMKMSFSMGEDTVLIHSIIDRFLQTLRMLTIQKKVARFLMLLMRNHVHSRVGGSEATCLGTRAY